MEGAVGGRGVAMFIDIHVHAYTRPGPRDFSTPDQLLERYDEAGIERGVILPLVSPEVYLPQSNEEVLEISEGHDGRFIPFCNIDPRALTNSAEAPLGDLLAYYRDQGCRGIGEVMANMPLLHPMVQNLFRHVDDIGFPLTFDMSTRIGGGYGLYDDPGLPQLERCLEAFPELIFLGHGPPFWAEIGELEDPSDRGGYPHYPVGKEGTVPRLMRRHDNLLGDLSAGSGHNALARDMDHAARFLEEFQDRLLFGTDICAPDGPIPLPDLLLEMRESGYLTRRAFDRIARGNAVRVLEL
jgi:predicted TIM-barrel fold metal-dependent hydrolase